MFNPLQTLQTYLQYALDSLASFMKEHNFEIPIQRSRAPIVEHGRKLMDEHDIPPKVCKVDGRSSATCIYATKGCAINHTGETKLATDASVVVNTERADTQIVKEFQKDTQQSLKDMGHEKNNHQSSQSQGEEYGPPGYDPQRVM